MSFRIPIAATLTWLAYAQTASAQLPQQSGAVDLLTQANVQVDGIADDDEIGESLATAGDVNGDGLGDVIAGADWQDVGRARHGVGDLRADDSGADRPRGARLGRACGSSARRPAPTPADHVRGGRAT